NKYLGAVDTPYNYFRWNYTISSKDLATILVSKGFLSNCDEVLSLTPLKRGVHGRISQLKIHYLIKGKEKTLLVESQYKIRAALHQKFLYSSAFVVKKEGSRFTLLGAGWGHGVGLCQVGAVGMALKGFSYEDILSHYFPEAKIVKAKE
ncbi:MAG: amidase, partial [Candidatus Dadabacteria bacterium]